MAKFQFLQTSHYGENFLYLEDESWEKALQAHLCQLSQDELEHLNDIYRVSNGIIFSCRDEINVEFSRRKEAAHLAELKKIEDQEFELYQQLVVKFAGRREA